MKKIFIISITLAIFSSCGYNISETDSVKDLLKDHTIFLDGDINFKEDGSFEMKPQSPSDPTQKYYGVWEIGYCNDCESENPTRDIKIIFKNTGYATDGSSFEETGSMSTTGYGTILEGKLEKSDDGYQIVFEYEASGNMTIDMEGNKGYDNATSFKRVLEKK
jgi:hypothetical protein